MSFLVPLFLLGLGAVAVPIIVHLTHRERRDPVPFPSLMFLERVPFRTEHRQRIRNWPLFLLRVALVALVAVAFARPFFSSAASVAGGEARDVVILLDRSASMAVGDRWTRAVQATDSALASLGAEDKATLVLFDDRARVVSEAAGGREAVRAALRETDPEPRATRYTVGLQMARDLLAGSESRRREALLITDLQRVGWREDADVRLPDGATFTLLDVSHDPRANAAVTDVTVERAAARSNVLARVAATAGEPGAVAVRLLLDGQAAGEEHTTLGAGAVQLVRFGGLAAPDRPMLGVVRLDADALTSDNELNFVNAPVRPVRVLLIESGSADPDVTLFLRRAMEVPRDPALEVNAVRGGLRARDMADRDLVIVNDATIGGDVQALRQFVEDGGGLFVVTGAGLSRLPAWLGAGQELAMVDRLGGTGSGVGITDYAHPVFRPFAAPRSGDFSAVRVLRYRRLGVDSASHVLARFDDGAPALVERAVGDGRVALWASGLDNRWNDLVVRPVFLPLIHRLVQYLARWEPAPAWYTAGQALDLASAPQAEALLAAAGQEDLIVEAPSGERSVLSAADRAVSLEETGFYRIRRVRGEPSLVVAVNADREESNLARLDPALVQAAVLPREANASAAGMQVTLGPEERERRQGLWWYLLLAVLVLLAAEAATAYLSLERR